MAKPFAKVRREDLEAFLRHEGEFWDVDANPAFEEFVTVRPLSVDDLLGAIESYAPDSDYVYAFCDSEFEAWDGGINPDRAPLIAESELNSFVVKAGRGDFLWIAPSAEDAANGSYVTILPSDGPVVEKIEEHAESPDEQTGPRLTSLAIENFKGIGEEIVLELRPITLLFGPNSAGKSSVLHALHYGREIVEHHNLDPDQLAAGGTLLDLGGFKNLVHDHDPARTVWLSFEIQDDEEFHVEMQTDQGFDTIHDCLSLNGQVDGFMPFFGAPSTAALVIGVTWGELRQRAYAASYHVFYDGEPFAEVSAEPSGNQTLIAKLDLCHPMLTTLAQFAASGHSRQEIRDLFENPDETCLSHCLRAVGRNFSRIIGTSSSGAVFEPILLRQAGSLPSPGESFDISLNVGWQASKEDHAAWRFAHEVAKSLCKFLDEPLRQLRRHLGSLRYLGPLRTMPSRHFHPPRFRDANRWADGLAAWDELASGDEQLIESVNQWLARDDRLNTGYRIAYRRFKEIALERVETLEYLLGDLPETLAGVTERVRSSVIGELRDAPVVNRLMLEDIAREIDVEPHDVGVGIAQLVPVVVAALSGRGVLNVIEQPELHVHPRLQAELGDLFIEAYHTRDQRFIIETHSEHLILRLLRRIRETGKGAAYRGMAITPDDVAVYYVAAEGTQTTVRRIEIDTRGEFVQPWPDDFFEIDFHERFG